MSLDGVDRLIQSPKRLSALAILNASEWAEFAFLQEHLDVNKADLSKQMKSLIDAGFVSSKRAGGRRGGTTWYRITKQGRKAFEDHLAALHSLATNAPVSTTAPDPETL